MMLLMLLSWSIKNKRIKWLWYKKSKMLWPYPEKPEGKKLWWTYYPLLIIVKTYYPQNCISSPIRLTVKTQTSFRSLLWEKRCGCPLKGEKKLWNNFTPYIRTSLGLRISYINAKKSWQEVICRQIDIVEMLVVVLSVTGTVQQEGSECMAVLKAIWPAQLTYIDIRFTFSVMDL